MYDENDTQRRYELFSGPLVGATLAVGAVVGIGLGTLLGYPGPGLAIGVLAGLMLGAGVKTLRQHRRDAS